MPDISRIRSLSPAALRIFKEQAQRKARNGDPNYSRLVSMPELADIFGGSLPTKPKPNALATAVDYATTPLKWIDKNITKPFGAIVTSPFTPDVPGAEGMNWLEKERAQYEQWKEPEFTMPWGGKFRPTKGVVESLPWFAIPSAGGVIGKLGGLAAKGGKIGAVAKAGQAALKPLAVVEALPGKVVGGAIQKLTGVVRQAEKVLPEQKLLTHQERKIRLAKAMKALDEGQGEAAYVNYMKELKGNIPDVSFKPIGGQLIKEEWDELANVMKSNPLIKGYEHATGNKALQKLKEGVLPVQSELDVLEKAFGPELVSELIKKAPPDRWAQALDIANAPRAVLSSFDMSAPLRQGAVLLAWHPIEALKTIRPMVKAFFSDKNASLVENIIMSRPNNGKALQFGLGFTPLPSKAVTSLGKMEEAFMSRFIDKIPVIGAIVRASNRAYVTVLNDLRSRSWEATLANWEKLGAREIDYRELAGFINAASGRGSLPKALRGASPLLNATLFSPKLLMSRIQLPTYLFSSSPLVRKEATRTLASFLGAGTGLLGLASLGGASIETDPRSSDFAKIKVGDTRLDIWAGYVQWARFVAQLSTGERKTEGGDVREINRKEVVERFLQSKSSPALGLLVDILKGESYMGEEISLDTEDLREQAAKRLLPLFIQDMMDAVYQQGAEGGLLALPGFLGVGVTTYMNPVQKMREEIASKKYGMSWEEVGKTMGNVAQRQLENENPQLTQLAEQEQAQYSKSIAGKADPNNRYRIEVGLIEDSYAKNIDLATQEFKDKGDGTAYREKINNIAMNRREQYKLVNMNPDYSRVVDYHKKPLDDKTMARMNPQDIARRAYNDLLYGDDMYDQYGNYRFDMIDPMRTAFSQQYGLDMLAYVEEYQNVKAKDMPPEYDMLKQAQSILRPYFEIETQIWSQYPSVMEQSAKEIEIIGRTDKYKERQMLSKYPQIVYIRKMIAYEKLRLKMQNPQIAQALSMFYSY